MWERTMSMTNFGVRMKTFDEMKAEFPGVIMAVFRMCKAFGCRRLLNLRKLQENEKVFTYGVALFKIFNSNDASVSFEVIPLTYGAWASIKAGRSINDYDIVRTEDEFLHHVNCTHKMFLKFVCKGVVCRDDDDRRELLSFFDVKMECEEDMPQFKDEPASFDSETNVALAEDPPALLLNKFSPEDPGDSRRPLGLLRPKTEPKEPAAPDKNQPELEDEPEFPAPKKQKTTPERKDTALSEADTPDMKNTNQAAQGRARTTRPHRAKPPLAPAALL